MEGLPFVGFFDHVRVSDLSSVRNPHFSSSRRGGHGVFDELRWVIQWWEWDYVVIFLRLHKGIQGSGELHLTMMPPGSLGQAFLQFLKSYIDMPAQDDMGQLLGLGVLITQGLGVFFWVSKKWGLGEGPHPPASSPKPGELVIFSSISRCETHQYDEPDMSSSHPGRFIPMQ